MYRGTDVNCILLAVATKTVLAPIRASKCGAYSGTVGIPKDNWRHASQLKKDHGYLVQIFVAGIEAIKFFELSSFRVRIYPHPLP